MQIQPCIFLTHIRHFQIIPGIGIKKQPKTYLARSMATPGKLKYAIANTVILQQLQFIINNSHRSRSKKLFLNNTM